MEIAEDHVIQFGGSNGNHIVFKSLLYMHMILFVCVCIYTCRERECVDGVGEEVKRDGNDVGD